MRPVHPEACGAGVSGHGLGARSLSDRLLRCHAVLSAIRAACLGFLATSCHLLGAWSHCPCFGRKQRFFLSSHPLYPHLGVCL